jgi:hypothetical protein
MAVCARLAGPRLRNPVTDCRLQCTSGAFSRGVYEAPTVVCCGLSTAFCTAALCQVAAHLLCRSNVAVNDLFNASLNSNNASPTLNCSVPREQTDAVAVAVSVGVCRHVEVPRG